MGGIAGQYFKQFGLTIAAAVFMSLLVARLITPLLAAYFLRDHGPDHEHEGPVMRGYTRLVRWSVRHKYITLVLGLACFVGSIMSTGLLPAGFLPAEDQARTLFVVELPPGARLQDTVAVSDRLVERIRTLPEVKSVFVDGGRQLPGKKEVRLASLTINLTRRTPGTGRRSRSTSKSARSCARSRTSASGPCARRPARSRPHRRRPGQGRGGRCRGPAPARGGPGAPLVNVMSTAPLDRTEIRIRPKPAVAADLGVSTDIIAETVRVGTIGDIGLNLAKFNATDRQIPIRVQLPISLRGQLSEIGAMKVPAKVGRRCRSPPSPTSASARGRPPSTATTARSASPSRATCAGSDSLGELISQVLKLPAAKDLPPGVTIKQTGDAEVMGEVFEGFALAMGAGLMMVFGVLILLFGSFLQPLTILFSLPLSIGGAILALLIVAEADLDAGRHRHPDADGRRDQERDHARGLRRRADGEGHRPGDRHHRCRPQAGTTHRHDHHRHGGGHDPLALALGIGGEFRAPMAIAVIGGLIVSTGLSLVFVPAIFVLMDDLSRVLGRLFRRFIGERDDPLDAPDYDHPPASNDGRSHPRESPRSSPPLQRGPCASRADGVSARPEVQRGSGRCRVVTEPVEVRTSVSRC